MKTLTGKTFAITLTAGLLALASVENHADELDLYLDDAMRTQVFEELKVNVQRLYEGDWQVRPVHGAGNVYPQAQRLGFPVAGQGSAASGPQWFGVLN